MRLSVFILQFLLFSSCSGQCLVKLDTQQDLLDLMKDNKNYNEFKNEIQSISASDLILFIDSKGCTHYNHDLSVNSFEELFSQYILNKNRLPELPTTPDKARIVILSDQETIERHFNNIERVYSEIRDTYIKLWNTYSYEHFKQESFENLDLNKKSELIGALPVRVQFRFNYLSLDSGNVENKIVQLGPISPFLYPLDKGLIK